LYQSDIPGNPAVRNPSPNLYDIDDWIASPKFGFNQPAQWISQADAAEIRSVTRQAIARLVKKGRFTTLSIGGKTLLKRAEVEDFKPKPPGPLPKAKQTKRKKIRH